MKIAIDISQIIYGTGVSTYTRNLVGNLLKIDSENEYILFGGSMRRYRELKNIASAFKGKVSSKILPLPLTALDLLWNKLHIVPVEKFLGPIDVFHSSDWVEPPSSSFKVTTVHDLYPFKFPRLVHRTILDVHRRKMSWVLRESQRIIVPSESTKKDLIELGANEERIRVIPEAPALSRSTDRQVEEAKKKYNIQGDYVIAIGATPLKNTKRIIEAFHLAGAGKDLKLLVVGRSAVIPLVEQRNVRILGHVPQNDLGPLLTGSKALIFASIYEGYGIPILDAFNCGVPVVTSTTASMPEVAGEAAVLVEPTDLSSITEGINKALHAPKGLIEKGTERIKNFSWEKTAKMTLDVYSEASN